MILGITSFATLTTALLSETSSTSACGSNFLMSCMILSEASFFIADTAPAAFCTGSMTFSSPNV